MQLLKELYGPLFERAAEPAMWAFLATVGLAGLIALVSPRWFTQLSARSNQWVDTSRALAWLDKRIDVDPFLAPYTRWLGGAALVSVSALASVVLHVH